MFGTQPFSQIFVDCLPAVFCVVRVDHGTFLLVLFQVSFQCSPSSSDPLGLVNNSLRGLFLSWLTLFSRPGQQGFGGPRSTTAEHQLRIPETTNALSDTLSTGKSTTEARACFRGAHDRHSERNQRDHSKDRRRTQQKIRRENRSDPLASSPHSYTLICAGLWFCPKLNSFISRIFERLTL
jgi:hypothetical protein